MPNVGFYRVPSYRKHKPSGQAVVTLSGKDHYLGRYESTAAKAEYDRLIADWLARGRQLPQAEETGMTVNQVILAFWHHCEGYYRKPDGTPTSELDLIRRALQVLKNLYGRTPAADFGPANLKAARQHMINKGWSRGTINKHVHRLKRLFAWATENELVPPAVYHGLLAVKGLKRGRSDARETKPVKPVPEAVIHATLPYVSPQVRALIELQLLTGMRPGEACTMRACDIDMTGPTWVYRPQAHKTEHLGNQREVLLGPQAQTIIKPFLKLDTQAYLFSPAEAEALRNAKRRAGRRTPMTPSHAARQPKPNRRRPWRDFYTAMNYRNAVYRACERAFPLPEHLAPRLLPNGKRESIRAWRKRLTPEEREEIRAWRREHSWHPHQLRHNAATRLRREYGIELARVILGHATAFTTEIYAEADRQQAMEAMARIG